MKIPTRNLVYINLGLNVLLLIIVVLSFKFSVTNTGEILSILGLVVTTIAFLVACYFLIIAMSVYSKISDIEKVKLHVDAMSNDFSEILAKANKNKVFISEMLINMTKLMDDFISQQIYFIDNGSFPTSLTDDLIAIIEKRRNSLIRKRSLMALKYPFMSDKRRCDLIREIVAVAKEQDIALLEYHSQNELEKQDVIETIKIALETIRSGIC